MIYYIFYKNLIFFPISSSKQRFCVLGELPIRRESGKHHLQGHLREPPSLPEVVQGSEPDGTHAECLLLHNQRPVKW